MTPDGTTPTFMSPFEKRPTSAERRRWARGGPANRLLLPIPGEDLANLYVAYARDISVGTRLAPTFSDAVRMHTIIDLIEHSSKTGSRVDVRDAL
jgi:predicted dehydrogenase